MKRAASLKRAWVAIAGGVFAVLAASGGQARTLVVCPAGAHGFSCKFKGDRGIQQAIDRAADGDTILIKAGRYSPNALHEVPYEDFTVRSWLLVEDKTLSITGEPGTILDGSKRPATALTLHRANVTLRNIEITSFRWDVEEDDFYDGHGVFVIDSRARIDNVIIRNVQKMGLTGRGDSLLDVSNLQVLDGHVGIWLHESAYLRLTHSLVRNNGSGGLSAYDDSVAHISSSVFDANLDDGLYTENQAAIYATSSQILRNAPYAAHALNESVIRVSHSVVSGNAGDACAEGKAVVAIDPRGLAPDRITARD